MLRLFIVLLFAGIAGPALAGPALAGPALADSPSADSPPASGVEVHDAWARPTAPMAKTGVVYMTIVNHGGTADTLVGVSTPAAGGASLHISSMVNGISEMRSLQSVEVKPGIDVSFAPDGMHVMLEDLKAPLTSGGTFPLTLHFAKAGDIQATVSVRQKGAGAMAMPGMKM